MLLGLACVWAGCSRAEPVKTVTPKTAADYFTIKVGEQPVRMQLAVLQPEMERGLMERRGLGQDEGMLFVYARPTQMSFWMHNTPTGLDIGFFSPAGGCGAVSAVACGLALASGPSQHPPAAEWLSECAWPL